MSDASEFFGTGTGNGIGLVPLFPPKRPLDQAGMDGYINDNDRIILPTSSTTALEYRLKTSALVWTFTPATIQAGATAWVSFTMDSVDALLWVMVANGTTTWLATIDVAGNRVVKGSAVNALPANALWYGIATSNARSGSALYRDVQGVGDFTLSAGDQSGVFSYINGAKLSNFSSGYPGAFKSTSGAWVSVGGLEIESNPLYLSPKIGIQLRIFRIAGVSPRGAATAKIYAPTVVGLPVFPFVSTSITTVDSIGFAALRWAGEVVLVLAGTPAGSNLARVPQVYDLDTFQESIDALVSNYKMDE